MKKNNSGIVTIALIAVLAAGGTYAYQKGYIPAFGAGAKAAEELKAEVESLKGNAIEAKVVQILSQTDSNIPMNVEQQAEFKKQIEQAFKDDIDINFEYTELKTKVADAKATVEISAPKLNFTSKKEDLNGELVTANATISRDIDDKNHYFYSIPGDLELYTTTGTEKTKLVTVSSESSSNEFKLNEQGVINYTKSSAKNIRFVEGRGNTTVLTIGDVAVESSQNTTESSMDNYIKSSYKNIVPGDTIKLIVGDIEPLSVTFDASYKGENITKSFYDAINESEAANKAAAQDPTNTTASVPKLKPFDGQLKVDEFSILTGNAGFVIKVDLQSKKENTTNYPYGDASLKLAQYKKLIDLVNKHFPLPPETINNFVAFLTELGKNENGDITISVKFDGTENVLVDGKTLDQIKTIGSKYFGSRIPAAAATPAGTTTTVPAIPAADPSLNSSSMTNAMESGMQKANEPEASAPATPAEVPSPTAPAVTPAAPADTNNNQ